MRRLTWTALLHIGVTVATVTLVACGPEDIELAHDDAGIRKASADGNATGILPGDDGAAPVCDAGAPPPACRALDAVCGSNSDCCSTHCASGTCVTPGTCAGAGASCTSRADCCSGLCEPTNGTTALTCLAQCRPDGVACSRASDCCSLDCNAGTCGGAECLEEGTDCTSSAQCCSNLCDPTQGNKCAIDPVATCRPSGESCNSGGKGMCCGVCDDALQRCDPGQGVSCRVLEAICSQPSDCCSGACTQNASGDQVCTGAPLANGANCQAGFECASNSCGSNPPVCGAQLTACIPTGAACGEGGACCSGTCAAGTCQSGCVPATR